MRLGSATETVSRVSNLYHNFKHLLRRVERHSGKCRTPGGNGRRQFSPKLWKKNKTNHEVKTFRKEASCFEGGFSLWVSVMATHQTVLDTIPNRFGFKVFFLFFKSIRVDRLEKEMNPNHVCVQKTKQRHVCSSSGNRQLYLSEATNSVRLWHFTLWQFF